MSVIRRRWWPGYGRGSLRARPNSTGPASSRSRTSPTSGRPDCSGCSRRAGSVVSELTYADYARVAFELARGQRGNRAGLQHARVGDRCAGRHPGRAGPVAGGAGRVLRRPRPDPAGGRAGRVLRGGDERARGRVPAVPADHPVRGGGRRLPHQGVQVVRLRGRARRRLPGGRPVGGRRLGGVPVPGAGRNARAHGRVHMGLTRHAVDLLARRAPRRRGAGRLPARRGGGPGAAGRPDHAALDGGQLRRGLRRGSTVLCGRSGRALPGPRSERAAFGAGPDRPGRRGGGRRPAGGRGGGPTGRPRRRANRRPTGGCGGPSYLAGTTAMDVAASMLEAAGTSASRRGHPLERLFRDARCGSLQPATSDVCADWLGIATLGGDPDADGVAPRW